MRGCHRDRACKKLRRLEQIVVIEETGTRSLRSREQAAFGGPTDTLKPR